MVEEIDFTGGLVRVGFPAHLINYFTYEEEGRFVIELSSPELAKTAAESAQRELDKLRASK